MNATSQNRLFSSGSETTKAETNIFWGEQMPAPLGQAVLFDVVGGTTRKGVLVRMHCERADRLFVVGQRGHGLEFGAPDVPHADRLVVRPRYDLRGSQGLVRV